MVASPLRHSMLNVSMSMYDWVCMKNGPILFHYLTLNCQVRFVLNQALCQAWPTYRTASFALMTKAKSSAVSFSCSLLTCVVRIWTCWFKKTKGSYYLKHWEGRFHLFWVPKHREQSYSGTLLVRYHARYSIHDRWSNETSKPDIWWSPSHTFICLRNRMRQDILRIFCVVLLDFTNILEVAPHFQIHTTTVGKNYNFLITILCRLKWHGELPDVYIRQM